jgi:hypothetical protein
MIRLNFFRPNSDGLLSSSMPTFLSFVSHCLFSNIILTIYFLRSFLFEPARARQVQLGTPDKCDNSESICERFLLPLYSHESKGRKTITVRRCHCKWKIGSAVAFIPTPSFSWWVGGCFISDKFAARKTRSQTLYLRLLMGGRVTSVHTISTISLYCGPCSHLPITICCCFISPRIETWLALPVDRSLATLRSGFENKVSSW